MMKKALILASVLAFTMTSSVFAETVQATTVTTPNVQTTTTQEADKTPSCDKPKKQECSKQKPKRVSEFEKRLNLSEEQIQKAKEIRMKGHKELKPLFEQMKQKRDEIEAVKRSRMAVEMQQEKIDALKGEIRELHKKIHDIRIANMKEFESILTKKQLKELNKMKKEGRKQFEKQFKKGHRPGGPEFRPGYGPKPQAQPQDSEVPPPPPAETQE